MVKKYWQERNLDFFDEYYREGGSERMGFVVMENSHFTSRERVG